MSPKAVFRSLLTLSLLAAAAGVVLSYTLRDRLPAPLQEFVRAREEAEPPDHLLVLLAAVFVLLPALFVGIVGLYLFWKPARAICLGMLIGAGPLLIVVEGAYVEPTWTMVLDMYSSVLAGAILGMSYCSPYRELFERRAIIERSA